ncbi:MULTISPECIES: GGDEF domain-containing protein [unclassified Marinobacter]|uniref:GGDEF domain-containing protein n=1 Tax=unclassified Marinobacter TaxID=83889 RepID=UPI0026E126A2|nr:MULTISPECIES: GGDEF domain-containing protein [unclassified Marinobacter]MDO6441034.1 GGDEF domain-containing protein [Marinobacter sp. 2_MG-2023]MDO6823870.1 GGDEF domain-containing protein [Marinobacter sp. 1_MG-2023]
MNNDNSTVNPASRRERGLKFWQVARRACQIAAAVDISFFFMFHFLGSPILAWINVGSVAMYAAAYYALERRQNRLAIALIWLEVIVHSALGTIMLGWGSGFHYYLLMFIPALCISSVRRSTIYSLLIGLWGYYIALDILMWFIEPVQPISPEALLGVHLFNLSVVFAMFAYLSFFYMSMVVSAQRKLRKLATVDSLTGLFNRRHGSDLADNEIARFRRVGRPVTFMLLDVDHFKPINDRYGHEMGDKILAEIGQLIPAQLRTQDIVARWGGEEFLVILPDTRLESALASAERIRVALRSHDWKMVTGEPIDVTTSVGVSEMYENDDRGSVIGRADRALYRGKAGGRNRVECGGAPEQ